MNVHLDILKERVLKPNKHLWFINVPPVFDCAEYLFENHYSELKSKEKSAVDKILLASGKYEDD